ncbi:MAG: hypothetical protein KC713_07580 [Candidatus Omnitrophica bacterium]|nr:hypothetical protein [Candidatus Omnitrophota bacterium]
MTFAKKSAQPKVIPSKLIQVTNNPYRQYTPKVSNGIVVWTDERDVPNGGNTKIWMRDLNDPSSSGNSVTHHLFGDQYVESFNNQILVYNSNSPGQEGLFYLNLDYSYETFLISENGYNAIVKGDYIIYQRSLSYSSAEVNLYRISTATSKRLKLFNPQFETVLYGLSEDYVVIVKNATLSMIDTNTQIETVLPYEATGISSVAISNDYILWSEIKNNHWDIFSYAIGTQRLSQITNSTAIDVVPSIYDNQILWEQYQSKPPKNALRAYNLRSCHLEKIAEELSLSGNDIDDTFMVWQDERYGLDNSDIFAINYKKRSPVYQNCQDE